MAITKHSKNPARLLLYWRAVREHMLLCEYRRSIGYYNRPPLGNWKFETWYSKNVNDYRAWRLIYIVCSLSPFRQVLPFHEGNRACTWRKG